MGSRIGIYNLWISGGGGSEKRTLVMAEHLSLRHLVFLIVGEGYPLAALQDYFRVDLSRIEVVRVKSLLPAWVSRRTKGSKAVQNVTRLIESRHAAQIRSLGLDVFMNNSWASNLPCPAPRGIYMCMFPHRRRDAAVASLHERFRNRLLGMSQATLDSYAFITANSQFTRSWVQRIWGRDAEVMYSAGEPMGPPVKKERMIVHVGRFTDETRADCKHQRKMLATFRKLDDLRAQSWQLHFVGTVPPDRASRKAAVELVRMARGYPVFFHFNASFTELRDLYRRASIYWHATGYGWPAEQYPERQEHFGLTTVEAMSAGVVPVVVNSGGQCESVTHGVSGYLWDDLDGLREYTRHLASDAVLQRQMSNQAISASGRFSRAQFVSRVEGLVTRVLKGEVSTVAGCGTTRSRQGARFGSRGLV